MLDGSHHQHKKFGINKFGGVNKHWGKRNKWRNNDFRKKFVNKRGVFWLRQRKKQKRRKKFIALRKKYGNKVSHRYKVKYLSDIYVVLRNKLRNQLRWINRKNKKKC